PQGPRAGAARVLGFLADGMGAPGPDLSGRTAPAQAPQPDQAHPFPDFRGSAATREEGLGRGAATARCRRAANLQTGHGGGGGGASRVLTLSRTNARWWLTGHHRSQMRTGWSTERHQAARLIALSHQDKYYKIK